LSCTFHLLTFEMIAFAFSFPLPRASLSLPHSLTTSFSTCQTSRGLVLPPYKPHTRSNLNNSFSLCMNSTDSDSSTATSKVQHENDTKDKFVFIENVFESGDESISKYRFTGNIPGAMSKESFQTTIREFKKNADFKGFRKGTIPPFMKAEIHAFTLQDCINTLMQNAMKSQELELLEGDAADPEFDIPFKQMKSNFEIGKPFEFTAQIALKKAQSDKDKENEITKVLQ